MSTTIIRPASRAPSHTTTTERIEPLYLDHRFARQLIRASAPQLAADSIAIQAALWIAHLVVSAMYAPVANHFLPFTLGVQTAFLVVCTTIGLYPGVGMHPAKELQLLFRAVNLANLLVAFGLLVISKWYSHYAIALAVSYPLQLALIPPLRGLSKSIALKLKLNIPFLYFGELHRIYEAQKELNRFGWARMHPVGRLHPPHENWKSPKNYSTSNRGALSAFCDGVPRLDTPEEMVAKARAEGVFLLVVAGPAEDESWAQHGTEFESAFPQVVYVNPEPSSLKIGASVVSWGICDGFKIEDALLMPGRRMVKRALDILVTATLIFALVPVFLAVAFAVWLTSEGPVIYGHSRIGYRGRSFKAWKFRTMVKNADKVLEDYLYAHPELQEEWELNQKLKNDPRITRVGRILRKTSLDELPQLFNVLAGHMSLVGPRPIVNSEIAKYGTCFASYLRVVPGITGLWQISGRNNTTYAERLKYDSYYVHNWSPWLDYYILLRTVKTVLKCEGAY